MKFILQLPACCLVMAGLMQVGVISFPLRVIIGIGIIAAFKSGEKI